MTSLQMILIGAAFLIIGGILCISGFGLRIQGADEDMKIMEDALRKVDAHEYGYAEGVMDFIEARRRSR